MNAAKLLPVPYSRQRAEGYCLPACVQMVLAYWGVHRSQDELGRMLGIVDNFGAPASNVARLQKAQMVITHTMESSIADVQRWLEEITPVIAYVQTAYLFYWHSHQTQHAVVVIGLDEQNIHVLDPAQSDMPFAVPLDEFLLAWDEMAFTMSVLRPSHSA